MFGCLRKIGCLVIILAIGLTYYWYTHRHEDVASIPVAGTWLSVTPEAAQRGQHALTTLEAGRETRVTLTPAEAAGALLLRSAKVFPPSAQGMQAAVTGDTLHVRAVVNLKELGAARLLGPMASMLGSGQDTLQLSGTASVVRPGLAQLRVTRVTVHDFTIPRAVLPRLLDQLRGPGALPEGVAADGIPLALPSAIGEVRISNGKVTVYTQRS
jgi:hypothetical protein